MSAGEQTGFSQEELTEDAFLDGRVRLLQPIAGYRAATDPVFLAAACPARAGERVLDLGSGAGAAAFCLAARVPGVRVEGLERQPAYAALSERNADRNGVDWRVWRGDVAAPPAELRQISFDHVITNPPFFGAETSLGSPDAGKDQANRETVGLDCWLDCALRRLKPRGSLTIIHRAERAPEILSAMAGRAGDIRLFPLWPRLGRPAKRVLIRAVKDSRAPFQLGPGLVLHEGEHEADGEDFSARAQAVLRDGAPLGFGA